MNTLPDSPQKSQSNQKPQSDPVSSIGMAKEAEPPVTVSEAPVITEIGKEHELPPEVTGAGVTMHPNSVDIPKSVADLGVQSVDQAYAAPVTPPVPLPLSDDQIAKGLHQSILSSWRWLAEWCVRQLSMAHQALKSAHGKIVRMNV